MNDREKLIALLAEVLPYSHGCPEYLLRAKAEMIADHLLANGVTIPTRCEDCKYKFSANGHNKDGCPLDGVGLMHDDDFCSCGERRDNNG